MSQAKECEKELQELLSSKTPNAELLEKAKAIQIVLADVIQGSDDPTKLEELFLLNDSITSLVSKVGEMLKKPATNGLGIYVPDTSRVSFAYFFLSARLI